MRRLMLSAALVSLAACTSLPTGPSVMVLPGSAKTFDEFRNDDYVCQSYALGQVGGVTPNQSSTYSGVGAAAIGTALGAAAGAAIGGGQGAAVGAGTGLVGGSLVGAGAASSSGYEAQERFDIAYIQCMYAKGHRVPVAGQFSNDLTQQPSSQPSTVTRPANIPPPPAGSPPPPPPSQ